jgi:hypothetical protein
MSPGTMILPAAVLLLGMAPAAGSAAGATDGTAGVPAASAPAAAQPRAGAGSQGADAGWAGWMGCWRPLGGEAAADAMVCVVPAERPGSVLMLAVEGGAVVEESLVQPDGVAWTVSDGVCTGTESAAWSGDGRRVYVRTEMECDGVRRVSTGVLAMVAENEWVDIQAVEVAGQYAARSVRYRPARPDMIPEAVAARLPGERRLMVEAARLQASAPLGVDAVVEASARLPAPVVEALIAARQAGFGMDARKIAELERRGVPPSVLDMMIAVSYPQRFAVQENRRERAEGTTSLPLRGGEFLPFGFASSFGFHDSCRDPWTFRRLSRLECERLMMRGYMGSSGFGYSPWSYDGRGWNYGRPIVVIVDPSREERQGGQMIRGQGYTPGSSPSTGRTARPRAEPATSTGSAGASATSGATGSSTSTTTTGTPTGRQAVPRPDPAAGGGGGDERQEDMP